jgi:hypothetical protein
MAYTPISNSVLQYSKNSGGAAASGYYLKFYASGTTTPISMATDSSGGTLLVKCQLNTLGYPINGSSDVFIPHIDQDYKLALYENSTDADNNTLASAAWVVDGIIQSDAGLRTDLIASTGTSLITHTQSGTEYNLATYLQNRHEANVKDFGAVSDGVTDDTTAWEACRDYVLADPFNRVLVAPAGQHYLPSGIDLWGVVYCRVEGNVVADNATDEVIIGNSVVSAPPAKLSFHSGNCTLKVHGLSRSHVEFTRWQELHIFSSNETGVVEDRYNVSYSSFYFTEVVHFRMETDTISGTTAWMNENKFFGARITGSLVMTGDYPMNNNIFYGFKMEGIPITIDANNGSLGAHSNQFHDARLEFAMSFTFGQYTFNNIFWQTWSNFANTMVWDLPAASYTINDSGDNNRIVPRVYEYIEKDQLIHIDVNNLDDSDVFEVSSINPDKVSVKQSAGTIVDTGLIAVTDKSWFTFKGDTASFFVEMYVYDEDGNPITTEPATGFKTSQGATSWNASGYWEYTSPVTGGNYAANPVADTTVKYVRYVGKTENGAVGEEHTSVSAWIAFPQEDKKVAKNVAASQFRIDTLSSKVSATSEATAMDLFKFTSSGGTTTDATGVLGGELHIALTADKGTSEDAASATVQLLVSREDSGNLTITAGTPSLLSNGGTLQINGITLGTKAGATANEAILTLSIQTNQADPFDSLTARARLVGTSSFEGSINYIIGVEKV